MLVDRIEGGKKAGRIGEMEVEEGRKSGLGRRI